MSAATASGGACCTRKRRSNNDGEGYFTDDRQKKTARPVSWSRRFARTFDERSSHSPRGAAGHNPLRGREWPEDCGIPARYHHPRGASVPCAWTVRIGPLHRFPVASSPREEVRCSVEDDFAGALQRPISSSRHREEPCGPSLPSSFGSSPLPNVMTPPSASALRSASVGIGGRRWIGGITRMVLRAPL